MTYRHINVAPIAGALGAEISGVDLSQKLDDETFAEIRRAYDENLVIFFRDQSITPEQHLAFGGRFGEFDIHPFAAGLPGHPEVLPIVKEADDAGANFGGLWHSDVTFYERPPLGSILYAIEAPAYGGDTLFANQYLAYETLSEGLRDMLDGMTAVHSARRIYGTAGSSINKYGSGVKSMTVRTGEDAEAEMEHPVVRYIPETGRRALFVNGSYTIRFKGWTEEESKPLLDYLCAHANRPEFTCRFRWRTGSVAFWDNRCAQHFALNDYHGQRREMHRVTIVGERPMWIRDGERSKAKAA